MNKFTSALIGGGILFLIINFIVKPLSDRDKNFWKRSSKTVIEKKIPDLKFDSCKLFKMSTSECTNFKETGELPERVKKR
tara:strand:- start:896 stop:1135 length:240 start_codon:yes stop_codon:yes gene_type:complete